MEPNPSGESLQLVFVYGTLKRGHQRNHVLADQTFIGPATTVADYRMYDLGSYPGLIEVAPGAGDQIQGEIYRIDPTCLRQIDQIEAVDQGLYQRREICLEPDLAMLAPGLISTDGCVVAYFYLNDIAGCSDCGDCW